MVKQMRKYRGFLARWSIGCLIGSTGMAVWAAKHPKPGLGAFSAPVSIQGTTSGLPWTWTGTVTLTPGPGNQRSLSGSGTFTLSPIPSPGPTVTGYNTALLNPGDSFLIFGSGFDTSVKATWKGQDLAARLVNPISVAATVPLTTPPSPNGATPITVTTTFGTVQGPPIAYALGPPPIPTPVPVPVPPGAINVRSFGAVGDGAADDTASIQKALNAAHAGDTVYIPSGVYKLTDQLKWNHPPKATIMGEGPTSIVRSVGGQGLYIGTGGEPGGPVTVTKVKFQGNPGSSLHGAIPGTGGIQVFGPANTVVDGVEFQDVTSAVYDAAPTQGTITRNSRVLGWARVAFFVEKNGQVTGCKVIQNDPNPAAGNTSHAFYIHGGASNVLLADDEIAGVAKYAVQQYSESPNTVTSGVQMRRLNIHDCQNGIVFAHSQQGAGDIMGSVVDGCTITNIAASGILIKDGDGVTISNNTISNCGSFGIALGVWAPYEPNFSLANVDVFGNTVTGCQTGLMGLASNGGSFSGCRFHGNAVSGNRQNLSIQSVLGLSYSPTGPKPPGRTKVGGI